MNNIKLLLLIFIFSFISSCRSLEYKRYQNAYSFIQMDYEEEGTKSYFLENFGIYVYDSIFSIKPKKEANNIEYYGHDIISCLAKNYSEKGFNKNLFKLSTKHNNSWTIKNIYNYSPDLYSINNYSGPTHIMIASTIENDTLRIDVVSNGGKGLQYCGSVNKYFFVFKNSKIQDSFKWRDHYECF